VKPGEEDKAFASLDRGPLYPDIYAMSGYKQPGRANLLDNGSWTRKVQKITARLGFALIDGIASHAELQCAAYAIDTHYIFPDESEEVRNLEKVKPCTGPDRYVISVNKPAMCGSCIDVFKELHNVYPEIQFEVWAVPYSGERNPKFYSTATDWR